MSFSDLDPAELVLGKPVAMMTDTELVGYLKLAVQQHQGVDLPVQGAPERSVMASLKRVYGYEAGNILKWACWRHDAKVRGEVIGFFTFGKKMKWLTDKLYVELQHHRQAEQARQAKELASSEGFTTLRDLQ